MAVAAPDGWANPLTVTFADAQTIQATFVPAKTFRDVPRNRADYAAIVALASRGTILGYNAEQYGPDDGVQRAQLAALIARATGAGPGTPTVGTLSPPACLVAGTWDCEDWGTTLTDQSGDPNLWRNAGTLQHYGVALGYTAGDCAGKWRTFPCYGPADPVTYAQTITFITRMMQVKGYWVAQPSAPLPYANVPGPHREDVRTFHFYTVGVPAPPPTGMPTPRAAGSPGRCGRRWTATGAAASQARAAPCCSRGSESGRGWRRLVGAPPTSRSC